MSFLVAHLSCRKLSYRRLPFQGNNLLTVPRPPQTGTNGIRFAEPVGYRYLDAQQNWARITLACIKLPNQAGFLTVGMT